VSKAKLVRGEFVYKSRKVQGHPKMWMIEGDWMSFKQIISDSRFNHITKNTARHRLKHGIDLSLPANRQIKRAKTPERAKNPPTMVYSFPFDEFSKAAAMFCGIRTVAQGN